MTTKPTLCGERITLRPVRPDDIDAYLALVQDEEGRRLTGTHASFTREQTEGWIKIIGEREGRVDLAIVPLGADELVGEVVLNQIDPDNRAANLRIGLRSSATDRGYGSEAIRLMLDYAFGPLGLHRVSLDVFGFNQRAIHVYEKLGFRREGVLRDALLLDGVFHDAIVMGILEDEYRQLYTPAPQH